MTTTYLLTATGRPPRTTRPTTAALAGAQKITNGSDNVLLDVFLDPTLGCTPFKAPDLSHRRARWARRRRWTSSSAAKQTTAPIALVPENDQMVLVNNAFSATKTNLYRSDVGQPPISQRQQPADSPANYCQNMVNVQTPVPGQEPGPADRRSDSGRRRVGNNLFTFLANRLNMSFTNLNCQNFGLTNPVTVTLDGNGVAIAATFNTAPQTATNQGATGMPAAGQRMGRHRHQVMNPSGM